jgi:hypothetical protein
VALTPPFVSPPASPLTRSTVSPRASRPRRGASRARIASSSPGWAGRAGTCARP